MSASKHKIAVVPPYGNEAKKAGKEGAYLSVVVNDYQWRFQKFKLKYKGKIIEGYNKNDLSKSEDSVVELFTVDAKYSTKKIPKFIFGDNNSKTDRKNAAKKAVQQADALDAFKTLLEQGLIEAYEEVNDAI